LNGNRPSLLPRDGDSLLGCRGRQPLRRVGAQEEVRSLAELVLDAQVDGCVMTGNDLADRGADPHRLDA
jgi:hypothetical protein